MSQTKTTGDTRGRLLEAACEVFAQKGYRDATIADISELAEANVASVNYHFGDKEHLYAEAWRHAFHIAHDAYPLDGGLPDTASPQQRLRAHVEAFLHRAFDDGELSQFTEILFSEMGTPTPALREVIDECVQPERIRFQGIVRELLGPDAEEKYVHLCAVSVMNQVHAFAFRRRFRKHFVGKEFRDVLTVEDLVDHTVRFSLAGIAEVRRWQQEQK